MSESSSGVPIMREEIAFVAGPKNWGDTRESWLNRVPRAVKKLLGTETETVSFRAVKALWYGEIENREHHAARDIRRAADLIKARQEALTLARQYQTIIGGLRAADPDFYSAEITRLEHVARLLGCGPAS
jgi:hypothetical protein